MFFRGLGRLIWSVGLGGRIGCVGRWGRPGPFRFVWFSPSSRISLSVEEEPRCHYEDQNGADLLLAREGYAH